jgi:hypothetical protein
MHTHLRGRSAAALTLASALALTTLTGCAIALPGPDSTTTEEAPVAEYGSVSEAVSAAVPRIVEVTELGQSQNGFGKRFEATLIVDSADPLSADELDAAVEAIWLSLPWEPNAISLVAGVDGADGPEPVDLRAAAAELPPMGFTNVGQGGASLVDMAARYGSWAAPR